MCVRVLFAYVCMAVCVCVCVCVVPPPDGNRLNMAEYFVSGDRINETNAWCVILLLAVDIYQYVGHSSVMETLAGRTCSRPYL